KGKGSTRGGVGGEGKEEELTPFLLFGLRRKGSPGMPSASVLDHASMRFRDRVRGEFLPSRVLETQLYIFARQCALYFDLQRPSEVARCAGRFMPAYYSEIMGLIGG
ncbi:unnamed protein product, partial [Discosporangium mesarthrocarpum]